ncbi:MAG: response regulator transcription factor [Saprospiraceae bacterium]|nr:response regulator transcription factor [Saprospiraceae bacterium]MCW5922348.1 response regulator transcription factor [Saprospiraceae bacterium]
MRFLNILVADDHPIFVEGLQSVLSHSGGKFSYHIKGVARTGTQVSKLLSESKADLLLMDLNLPEADGLKILPSVKQDSANTRVLVMTVYDDPRLVKAAFKAGADGYMLKSGTKDELFDAIEKVIDGQTYLGSGLALVENRHSNGADGISPDKRFARKYGLTRREMEVMRLIGQAMNNKEIAEKLFISDQTVSVHRKNIMRKLGVNNTATMIKIAFENNLV